MKKSNFIKNCISPKKGLSKTLKTTMLFCFISIMANSQTIITIDNSPTSITTFQTIQEAHDAATSGDIIYVQPTATSYGNVIIDKAITIVGRSYREVNNISTLGTITIRSSNVTIKGIQFSNMLTNINGPNPLPFVGTKLYECRFNNANLGVTVTLNPTIALNDVEIQGCVFSSFVQFTDTTNILISNNIITNGFLTRNPTTLVISNNIFRAGSGNISLSNLSSTETVLLFNNMFTTNFATNRTVTLNNGDFNFSNCLTYNYGVGNLNFVAGTGTFLENNSLLNTNPLFTDIDSNIAQSLAGASTTYNPAIRMDDLTLQAGSPALTGGGGGSEIGLYNNGFNYNIIGNPRDIPTMDITNYDAAVPINGTINVTITAKAH